MIESQGRNLKMRIDNNCDYTVKGFQRAKSFAKNAKFFANFNIFSRTLILRKEAKMIRDFAKKNTTISRKIEREKIGGFR